MTQTTPPSSPPGVTGEPTRHTSTVAADLAIQQENEGLRLALREQERIVEQLTNECRRLEDRLEDRYQDIDALRRELERTTRALKEAEARAAGMPAPPAPAPPLPPEPHPETVLSPRPVLPAFVGGFAAGMVTTAAAAALAVWLELWPQSSPPPPTAMSPPTPPAPAPAPAPVTPSPAPSPSPPLAAPSVPRVTALGEDEEPAPPVNEPLTAGQPPVAGKVRDPGGLEMVALRPARFTMGNPVGAADSDARPTRVVTLPAYLIGVYEVTFDEYDRFVRATGGRRPNDFGWGRGNRPVVDVSWDDALAYARWLSRETGKRYRLPSEAEWEYAARGGVSASYWWGTGSPLNRALCIECGTRWDRISTAPVGSFPPNPFGLHDTAGNVYEWTADCYHYNYREAPHDGTPWDEPDCRYRVVRGGSFSSPASAMRSYERNRFASNTRVDMIGFRLARDPEPADGL